MKSLTETDKKKYKVKLREIEHSLFHLKEKECACSLVKIYMSLRLSMSEPSSIYTFVLLVKGLYYHYSNTLTFVE